MKVRILGKARPVINCHCSQCVKINCNFGAYTEYFEKDLILVKKVLLSGFNHQVLQRDDFVSTVVEVYSINLLKVITLVFQQV